MEIQIPENVEIKIENHTIIVKGEKGEVFRKLDSPFLNIEKRQDKIFIGAKSPRKKVKALMGTFRAHIKNMIKGVTEGFEYRLKINYVHFPMSVKTEDDRLVVQNFMGEKSPIYIKILDGVKVNIDGDEIILTGIDKEKVGQTAANIERTQVPGKKDKRVFRDGIFIIKKG